MSTIPGRDRDEWPPIGHTTDTTDYCERLAGFKRDYSGWATPVPRSAVGVRYYFVDFGISTYIPEDASTKLVTGNLGRDQDPPELSTTIPYDPFKLDVFIIGNMFRQKLYEVSSWLTVIFVTELRRRKIYTNIDFLLPLVEGMMHRKPEERPTAE